MKKNIVLVTPEFNSYDTFPVNILIWTKQRNNYFNENEVVYRLYDVSCLLFTHFFQTQVQLILFHTVLLVYISNINTLFSSIPDQSKIYPTTFGRINEHIQIFSDQSNFVESLTYWALSEQFSFDERTLAKMNNLSN